VCVTPNKLKYKQKTSTYSLLACTCQMLHLFVVTFSYLVFTAQYLTDFFSVCPAFQHPMFHRPLPDCLLSRVRSNQQYRIPCAQHFSIQCFIALCPVYTANHSNISRDVILSSLLHSHGCIQHAWHTWIHTNLVTSLFP